MIPPGKTHSVRLCATFVRTVNVPGRCCFADYQITDLPDYCARWVRKLCTDSPEAVRLRRALSWADGEASTGHPSRLHSRPNAI